MKRDVLGVDLQRAGVVLRGRICPLCRVGLCAGVAEMGRIAIGVSVIRSTKKGR